LPFSLSPEWVRFTCIISFSTGSSYPILAAGRQHLSWCKLATSWEALLITCRMMVSLSLSRSGSGKVPYHVLTLKYSLINNHDPLSLCMLWESQTWGSWIYIYLISYSPWYMYNVFNPQVLMLLSWRDLFPVEGRNVSLYMLIPMQHGNECRA
jgi:hypothetical protein